MRKTIVVAGMMIGAPLLRGLVHADSVDDLILQLNTDKRRTALRGLEEISDPRSIDALARAADEEISESIAKGGGGGFGAAGALRDMRRNFRRDQTVLKAIDEKVVVLTKRLNQSTDKVEQHVLCSVLEEIGSPAATSGLLTHLEKGGGWAPRALMKIKDSASVEMVKNWTMGHRDDLAVVGAQILAGMDTRSSHKAIKEIIASHQDAEVRKQAQASLPRLRKYPGEK